MAETATVRIPNRRVLVTRPAQQAEGLCRLLKAAGASLTELPVIEIVPVGVATAAAGARVRLQDSDLIIFISRNAVRYCARLITDLPRLLAARSVCAVGAGTRAELHSLGLTGVVCAQGGSGSEALLALDALGPGQVAGRSVLIVRGEGGRELLRETLEQRGAIVGYLEVYRRRMPVYDPAEIDAVWRRGRPEVIVVTSTEGLDNLVRLTGTEHRATLLGTRLVVVSQRIAESAAGQGFTGVIRVAASPDDAGILEAVAGIFEV